MIEYDDKNCQESPNIVSCRFTYHPDYSPILTLSILIGFIFVILPRILPTLNYIIFNKLFKKWSLIEFLFHRKEKLVKKFTSKKSSYLINSEFT